MKTNLNRTIKTVQQAKDFLTELIKNNEHYHPEDDAFDIIWNLVEEPTKEEKTELNRLMEEVYNFNHRFDPCQFILDVEASK